MATKTKKTRKSEATIASEKLKTKAWKSRQPKTLYEQFKPFIGMIKDGPRDLAENHKLYASGAKKWK